MQAGRLRHRVTIQGQGSGQSSTGEPNGAWAEVGTYWASVEPLRGREFLESRSQQALVDTRVKMRFNRVVKTKMRLVWVDETDYSHIYDIESVIHIMERQRETQLMCREVLNDGES